MARTKNITDIATEMRENIVPQMQKVSRTYGNTSIPYETRNSYYPLYVSIRNEVMHEVFMTLQTVPNLVQECLGSQLVPAMTKDPMEESVFDTSTDSPVPTVRPPTNKRVLSNACNTTRGRKEVSVSLPLLPHFSPCEDKLKNRLKTLEGLEKDLSARQAEIDVRLKSLS